MASNVADKIRKLLQLAESNNSVEEAALAASRAQELMHQHQIRAEDLVIPEDEPEPTTDGEVLSSRRYETWKARLLVNLAGSMGARVYSETKLKDDARTYYRSYRVVGLESVVQTVQYMSSYLINEINGLTENAWADAVEKGEAEHGKTWKNNFRLGAVTVISNRLMRERQKQERQVAQDLAAQGPTQTGLVLYQTDQLRQKEAYEKVAKEKGLRSRTDSGGKRNWSAFEQGKSAGSKVSLGGGKGLGTPAKPLPK